MKLKHMKRRQRTENRIIYDYRNIVPAVKQYHKVPVVRKFVYTKRTQDWNPDYPHELDTKLNGRVWVSAHIQCLCEYLKDLFCIEDKILLDISPKTDRNCGFCSHIRSADGYIRIMVGARGGLRATTLVHEFLHAAGFSHAWAIDGHSDYRSTCTKDTYSKLIVKDIFGRKEVLLT